MSEPDPLASAFFARQKQWQAELLALREAFLSTPFSETLKWYNKLSACKDCLAADHLRIKTGANLSR